MNEESRDYYVYVLFRGTRVPFYVGKGTGDRWNDHWGKCGQGRAKTYKDKVVRKMKRTGEQLFKVKFAENLTNETALLLEKTLIKSIGRYPNGPLVNGTDGGEGTSNPSAETRAKWSAAHKGNKYCLGKKHSPEARRRMSLAKMGNDIGPEARERVRQAHLGKTLSLEARAKISAKAKGRKFSAEHRANMSLAKMACNLSPETLAKRSKALTGQKRTLEQRQRMSSSHSSYVFTEEHKANLSAARKRRVSQIKGSKDQ